MYMMTSKKGGTFELNKDFEKFLKEEKERKNNLFLDYLDALIPYLLIAIIMALIFIPRTFIINNPILK